MNPEELAFGVGPEQAEDFPVDEVVVSGHLLQSPLVLFVAARSGVNLVGAGDASRRRRVR